MVGFRNIAVRDYEAIDVGILQRIVAESANDLQRSDHGVVPKAGIQSPSAQQRLG